jgi:hypothetical protein
MGNPHRVEGEQIYQKDTDNTHAKMHGIPAVSKTQVSRALFAHMDRNGACLRAAGQNPVV